MTPQVQLTLDRIVRVVIAVGLVLSVLGTPAVVSVAQAKTVVAQPVSAPKPEVTQLVETEPAVALPIVRAPQATRNRSTLDSPLPAPPVPVVNPLVLSDTLKIVAQAGGRLSSADQRVQLDVPPGLFQRNTRLKIAPRAMLMANAPAGARMQFELTAQDVPSDTLITEFAQPLTITVDLNGVVDKTQLQPWEHLALFHETNNPDAPWAEVIDAVEIRSGVLQARVQHFSALAAGSSGDAPAGWQLKYNPPVVSTFSGAATFNYPIEVAPGRNGLQPSIVLGYSSRSVDGVVSTNDQDSDGVPFGWALDMASISRDGTEIKHCGGCGNPNDGGTNSLELHPRFSLAINGANYQLLPKNPGQKSGQYYAKDAPGLYVERRNDAGWNGTTTNTSHEFWVVKTGDGTTYRLGYNSDSEQTQSMGPAHYLQCVDGGYCGAAYGTAAVRWRVDRMADTFGNVITVTYQTKTTEQTFDGSGLLTAEHTRPSEIKYNFNNGVAASRIVFSNSTDNTYNWINRIAVYHAGETNKVREHQLGWDNALVRMTAITQTNAAGTQWLPPTTFTHTDLRKDWWYLHYTPYLTRVDNGYGGATEFSYLDDQRFHYRDVNGLKIIIFGYSYRVIETRTYDGLNSAPAKVQYEYEKPCYDQFGGGAPGYCRGTYPSSMARWSGIKW